MASVGIARKGDFIKINRSNTAKGMTPDGHSPNRKIWTPIQRAKSVNIICKDGVTLKAGMENMCCG